MTNIDKAIELLEKTTIFGPWPGYPLKQINEALALLREKPEAMGLTCCPGIPDSDDPPTCKYAGPGRGDCEHFVGLPSGLNESTTDVYGKPNDWCWFCWLSYRLVKAQEKLDPTDLSKKLRQIAEMGAENRRIAEYGPGGGNPDAKAEEHIEWKAADLIDQQARSLRIADEALSYRHLLIQTLRQEIERIKMKESHDQAP
jgi:hypothetical protein